MTLDDTRVGISVIKDKFDESVYKDEMLIASLLKEALISGGLGITDQDSPMLDIIKPGMTVLLKPNWVLHYNKSGSGMECMITQPAVIEAVLKEVLKAKPGKVIIGDAPIQSAIFEDIVQEEWIAKLKKMTYPAQLEVIDFRSKITSKTRWTIEVNENPKRPEGSYVLFDLASESLLEPISGEEKRFRNTSYNHEDLAKTHHAGRHQFLLCREAFDCDVIINLPKLKSHRKAGLTAALKNIVGLNGDKNYLPHHRIGGSAQGGDCYEGKRPFKRVAEYFTDLANQNINTFKFALYQRFASLFIRLNKIFFKDSELEGSWYGNDTTWRMVLDLNRILLYGNADGSISKKPERKVFSITDAIIAGEGLGPLAPTPKNLGVITFASSSAFADLLHSALMLYDWEKIPSIHNAFNGFTFPLTGNKPEDIKIYADGRKLSLSEASKMFGKPFKTSNGWKGHIECTTNDLKG
jgi:uncharacterized protein (DUF362 family)